MEVDGPYVVVGFLHADPLIREGVGDVDQPLATAKGTGRRDRLHEEVARVFGRRESRGIGSLRGGVL